MNAASHMCCKLQPHTVVEHRPPRVDVGDLTVADRESGGVVHPRVDRHHTEGADDACDAHRDEHRQVPPWWHPAPAVQIDAEEYRLDEERQSLERERQSEYVTEPAHQPRPEQAHLEAEDGAGHRTDREQHRRDLGPPLRESQCHGIVADDAAPVHHVDDRGKRDAEARQNDVPAQRNRHLLPCGQQPGRLRRQQQRGFAESHLCEPNPRPGYLCRGQGG